MTRRYPLEPLFRLTGWTPRTPAKTSTAAPSPWTSPAPAVAPSAPGAGLFPLPGGPH